MDKTIRITKLLPKAIDICKEFGIELADLYMEPRRQAPKPDIRKAIAYYFSNNDYQKLSDKDISKLLDLDRSSIPYNKKEFKKLYETDASYRERCTKLGIKIKGDCVHLRFSMNWVPPSRRRFEHPTEILEELGITYQHVSPKQKLNQFWFWNCENIPNELPPYLHRAKWNPEKHIGGALTKDEAIKIVNYNKNR